MKAKKTALSKIKEKLRDSVENKIKVLTISDDPRLPSGVGTQTKYVCEALLESGQFEIVSLGSAVSVEDRQIEQVAENWKVIPAENYGNKEIIRSLLRSEKPDILWFMTDPRFYGWLWHMEDEIRSQCPMVYYHVWDNYPVPDFNKDFYDSTDVIASISKLTHDIVTRLGDDIDAEYIPHAVNPDIFKSLPEKQVQQFIVNSLGEEKKDTKIFFWNNRNAKRKQSGTLIFWFKEFLKTLPEDEEAILLMHTEPKDPHGQDLHAVIDKLDLTNGEVLFSQQKVNPEVLSMMYNAAHCTINISDAEGFGLSCLESLSCGTPVIVSKTGGLQDQALTDEGEELGRVIEPVSKAVIGSQEVPYIYEDRLNKNDFVDALHNLYYLDSSEYKKLSQKCIKQVDKNFNFSKFKKDWVDLMVKTHEKYGSWPVDSYDKWHIEEI